MASNSRSSDDRIFKRKPSLVRSNLSDQIYEFLEEEIVSGRLRPGTKLSELMIAETLEVSRQPVREAIARLERLGLASRGRRDRVVARPTERFISDTYEVWWVLDASRTYLSSLTATEADVARLRTLLAGMEDATRQDDRAALARSSAEFHKIIASRSQNAQLDNALKSCALYIRWFRGLYLKHRSPSEARLKDHQRIVECYARRDLAGLIDVVREHVLRQRTEVLEAWREESLALEREETGEEEQASAVLDRLGLASY